MIDEKGRIFGKINIFDLAVLLIIVVLVIGYLYRDGAAPVDSEGKTVVVKVICPNVYPGVENNLQAGDLLVAGGSLTSARITEMKTEEANWVVANSEGKMVMSQNPFRKDIFLTLEGKSTQISPAEISFAGQKVRAGKEDFYVKTQKTELKATVVSVEIKS